MSALETLGTVGTIILVIVGILAVVGIVFANGVSVLWATFIFFGIVLTVLTFLSFFNEEIGEGIEKFDLSSKLRGFLGRGGGFSVGGIIPRILILIMSAASVAIIVRAIIFVVNVFVTQGEGLTDATRDRLIDLISDVPVLNVLVLMTQGFNTELRPDFFVIALLGSLIVLGIAAIVVQVIMSLINKVIYEAKEDSMLFMILGNFSITVLTAAGTIFLSSLISPLLDFSKPWDGFEDFCRPFLSSNVGNFLLQVLAMAAMFALLVLICFDWMQTMVLSAAGFLVWFIIMLIIALIKSLFTGSGNVDSSIFFPLLFILYPIVDIIKNRIFDDERSAIVLPVAVPLGLSVIITLIAIVIGKMDAVENFFKNMMGVGLVIFIVYLLVMPGIDIIKSSDE